MKKENLISVFCQLKNRKINVGECYDIQMVINGYIKPEALSEQISFENANSVCTFCKYNQLREMNLPPYCTISKMNFLISRR